MIIDEEIILTALEQVTDPEIPIVSIVDLGIITGITSTEGSIHVTMTPTFVGCPAIEVMKQGVEEVLKTFDCAFTVDVNYDIPWDSNRVSEKGRKALKDFGLAPPPVYDTVLNLDILHSLHIHSGLYLTVVKLYSLP